MGNGNANTEQLSNPLGLAEHGRRVCVQPSSINPHIAPPLRPSLWKSLQVKSRRHRRKLRMRHDMTCPHHITFPYLLSYSLTGLLSISLGRWKEDTVFCTIGQGRGRNRHRHRHGGGGHAYHGLSQRWISFFFFSSVSVQFSSLMKYKHTHISSQHEGLTYIMSLEIASKHIPQ